MTALHHQEAMDVGILDDAASLCTPEEAWCALLGLDLSCSLRVFGCQLGVQTSYLDEISPRPYNEQLLNILSNCSDHEQLTWTKIVRVLIRPALEEFKVASQLQPQIYKDLSGSSETDSASSLQSPRSPTLLDIGLEHYLNKELEIAELVNEIAVVKHLWTELGIALGASCDPEQKTFKINKGDIEMIRESYNPKEYHQRLAELLCTRNCKVTRAKLQQEVDKLYPRRASVSLSQDIETQIKDFEAEFKKLNMKARRELEARHKDESIEVMMDELACLPHPIATENRKEVKQVVAKKQPFVNLRLLFAYLNSHMWNFFEYKVLQSVVSSCSENLKLEMTKYAESIDNFRRQTTITEFIKNARYLVKKRSIPTHFKKITTEHAIDPDTYTLADLDAFRTDTLEALHLKLSECALHVYRMKYGSLLVKWMIYQDYLKQVIDFFHLEDSQQILMKHNVVRIKANKSEATIQSLLLLTAAKNGDAHKVQSLLDDPKANINYQQHFVGWTALHLAATEGHVEVAELLLKKGCNINLLAGEGWTPLQRVCLYKERHIARRGEMVNLLLDHDARLNVEDRSGRNPLFAASTSGFVDIVKILLERIAKLPSRIQRRIINNPMMNGWFPIMDAAMHGHAEVVKLLLEAGATAIKTKEDDETALHIAAYHGHVDVVKVLTAGKDRFLINARDQYGLTPLMMAVSRNNSEVADVLLEAGADVNLQSNDKEKRTALMLAAKNGAFSIVKLLMKHKPDVSIKDSKNKTALDLASTSEVRHCLTEKPVTKQETEIGVST